MGISVNIPQASFLNLSQRFKAFVGGYGSGKTFVGCVDICKNFLENPGKNQGYFAPTYPQIRDIFYPTIEEVSGMMGLDIEINQGNKEVHFYTGKLYRGTCICRSLDRPHSIIGFKISHALLDEIDVLSEEKALVSWRKVLARMRYIDSKNSVDVTTTPEGFLFTYNTFVKNLRDNPEMRGRYALIQASTFDNERNLPPDYIPSLIESYPKELISAYLNGQFVNLTSGTVYYSFDRFDNNSKEIVNGKELINIGMDFNVQDMAAVIYVEREDGWHAVDELKEVFDTPAMIRDINRLYPDNKKIVYPDASGDSRKSVDASQTDIKLLRDAGFLIRVNKKNPYIKDRVMAVNKKFEDKSLWVNVDRCPVVAESLEHQVYDVKTGLPSKKSGHDHMNDAFGYPIAHKFPIIKPQLGLTNIRMVM